MRDKIGDKQRLEHILEAISSIEEYVQNANISSFKANSMMRFASIKQIEIIGEAANYLTIATKDKIAGINWKQIIGMRHILVHEYFGIDADLIWQVITNDLPALKNKVSAIVDTL